MLDETVGGRALVVAVVAEQLDRVGAHEVVLSPDAVAHPFDDMGAGQLPDQPDGLVVGQVDEACDGVRGDVRPGVDGQQAEHAGLLGRQAAVGELERGAHRPFPVVEDVQLVACAGEFVREVRRRQVRIAGEEGRGDVQRQRQMAAQATEALRARGVLSGAGPAGGEELKLLLDEGPRGRRVTGRRVRGCGSLVSPGCAAR